MIVNYDDDASKVDVAFMLKDFLAPSANDVLDSGSEALTLAGMGCKTDRHWNTRRELLVESVGESISDHCCSDE